MNWWWLQDRVTDHRLSGGGDEGGGGSVTGVERLLGCADGGALLEELMSALDRRQLALRVRDLLR